MSYDFAIWKWKKKREISAVLCYLMLSAGRECLDVEPLDVESISKEVVSEFPGWERPEGECPFDCDVFPQVILLLAYASTPPSSITWFRSLAARHGFTFFDARNDRITDDDARQMNALEINREAADSEFKRIREIPELLEKAAGNDPEVLTELGLRCFFGAGVTQSHERAFRYYEEAARLGDAGGMFNLAAPLICRDGWEYRAGFRTAPSGRGLGVCICLSFVCVVLRCMLKKSSVTQVQTKAIPFSPRSRRRFSSVALTK